MKKETKQQATIRQVIALVGGLDLVVARDLCYGLYQGACSDLRIGKAVIKAGQE